MLETDFLPKPIEY